MGNGAHSSFPFAATHSFRTGSADGSEPLLAIPASCDGDMNTFFFTTMERWRIERLIPHHAMAVIRSAVLPPSELGGGTVAKVFFSQQRVINRDQQSPDRQRVGKANSDAARHGYYMNNFLSTTIELWPAERLIPYDRNARTHSDEQIEQIPPSIREFGFTNPILVDTWIGILDLRRDRRGRSSLREELVKGPGTPPRFPY